jgi:hypothetical protein
MKADKYTRYIITLISLLCVCKSLISQNNSHTTSTNTLVDELSANIISKIEKEGSSNFQRGKILLNYLASEFKWVGTDYKQRTVNQIIARRSGNCFELAKVYIHFIKVAGIKYRPIAEINIHAESEERQIFASKKVEEGGNRMSVFGRNHNDHRWVEIFDDIAGEWIPVDPSMNLIGKDQWLKARMGFGERVTLDTGITNKIIVPIALFVVDTTNKFEIVASRSSNYLIAGFNELYNGTLQSLPSWNMWSVKVNEFDAIGKATFQGTTNLHLYGSAIEELKKAYLQLKHEYSLNR